MPDIDQAIKNRLKAEYEALNPAQLKREIVQLQNRLTAMAARRRRNAKSSTICRQNNQEIRMV